MLVVERGGAHPFVACDVGVVGGRNSVEGIFIGHLVHAASGKGEKDEEEERFHGGLLFSHKNFFERLLLWRLWVQELVVIFDIEFC